MKSIDAMRRETEKKLAEAEKAYKASVERIMADRATVPDFRPPAPIVTTPDHGREIAELLERTKRIDQFQRAPREVTRNKEGRLVGVKVRESE